jgi:hypothetical protein
MDEQTGAHPLWPGESLLCRHKVGFGGLMSCILHPMVCAASQLWEVVLRGERRGKAGSAATHPCAPSCTARRAPGLYCRRVRLSYKDCSTSVSVFTAGVSRSTTGISACTIGVSLCSTGVHGCTARMSICTRGMSVFPTGLCAPELHDRSVCSQAAPVGAVPLSFSKDGFCFLP